MSIKPKTKFETFAHALVEYIAVYRDCESRYDHNQDPCGDVEKMFYEEIKVAADEAENALKEWVDEQGIQKKNPATSLFQML